MKKKQIKVAFDCNGTLLDGNNPNEEMIKLFHLFESLGCKMYVWSNCGVDFSYETAMKLGLTAICTQKNTKLKPDVAIDDSNYDNLGGINLKVGQKEIEYSGMLDFYNIGSNFNMGE